MEQNYVSEIKSIIMILKDEKLDAFATELEKIYDTSFSGTELLMATQMILKQIPKSNMSLATQNRIENLLIELRKFFSK